MPYDTAISKHVRRMRLPRRSTLVLEGATGTVVSVDDGCVWITLERDPRDIVLVAGMRFEIDRDGRTVVMAEEDTRLRLTQPLARSIRVATKLGAYLRRAARRFLASQSYRLVHQRAPYY